jgi:hypothetical protein
MNPMASLRFGIFIYWNDQNSYCTRRSAFVILSIRQYLNKFSTVRRPFCKVFALPFKSHLWWDVLGANSTMGYPIKASASFEDASIRCWTHASRVCYADGRNPECTQSDHKQYRRVSLQLVGRYAGTTTGKISFRSMNITV